MTISDLKESAEASPPSEPDPEEKSATEPAQEDVSVKEVCNLTWNISIVEDFFFCLLSLYPQVYLRPGPK